MNSPNSIPAARCIPVRDSGPVDENYYPIYDPEYQRKQIVKGPTSREENELDYLNNDQPSLLERDNRFDDREHDPFHDATGLLKPGTASKSEDGALHFYGLVDSIRPYHDEQVPKATDGMIWISGHIVATKEEVMMKFGFNTLSVIALNLICRQIWDMFTGIFVWLGYSEK